MDLVFIHGAADSGAVWGHQIDWFSRLHRVLPVDLPGHGARLAELAYAGCDRSAEDVVEQIQDCGFVDPILVGHSMGGAIALTVALARPELPSAILLVGSGARLRIPPRMIESARNTAERSAPGIRVERAIPLDEVVSPAASPDVRAWLADRIGHSTGQATHADFVATDRFDVMDRLHEIQLPALVIGGEEDRWTPPRFQRFFGERIAGSRVMLLPRCGHYPFVEHAEAFNVELDRLISRVAASARAVAP